MGVAVLASQEWVAAVAFRFLNLRAATLLVPHRKEGFELAYHDAPSEWVGMAAAVVCSAFEWGVAARGVV